MDERGKEGRTSHLKMTHGLSLNVIVEGMVQVKKIYISCSVKQSDSEQLS